MKHHGILVGSSDFDRVIAHREELKRGHEERLQSINLMTFSVKRTRIVRHGKPYILLFDAKVSLKVYLKTKEDIAIARRCGFTIHYE